MAERSPIDEFRRALAGAARAIAQDAELDVAFASEAATSPGKIARVPSPGPALEPQARRGSARRGRLGRVEVAPSRCAASCSCRAGAMPRRVPSSMRWRPRGLKHWERERWAEFARTSPPRRCTGSGDAIVRARTAEEVPLATAVGLIARERLTGDAPPSRELRAEARFVVDRGEGRGRARCAGADARRPGGVRQIVAPAARRSRPRLGRGAERGRTGRGRGRRGGRGRRKRGHGGAGRRGHARRRRRRDARRGDRGRAATKTVDDEMEAGEEESSAGDDLSESVFASPSVATGSFRLTPITRHLRRASTRSSRRRTYATRKSSLACALISTSRWRGLQNVVTRLANRLQRRLLAQQTRSWDFDQEEGLLDAARLARVVVSPAIR